MVTNVRFDPGATVSYAGKNWRVVHAIDFDRVLLQEVSGAGRVTAPTAEVLGEIALERSPAPSVLMPDVGEADWVEANRRYGLIKPLVRFGSCTKVEVRQRAVEVNVSYRTLYRYLRAFSQTHQISSLLPRKTQGGKQKGRLSAEVEELISGAIENLYLKKQRPPKKDIAIEVIRECKARGLKQPSRNTVIRRINWLKPQLVLRRRYGAKAAKQFEAHPGTFDRGQYPLAVVEIDHTKLDAILVDEQYRQPIGRAWITLVQDVFSRMIIGYYVSLDPTGALSTGLAIAQAIMRKDTWLLSRGIDAKWPCWGVMQCIHADNALEFHGKMLERACQEYCIDLMFRRPGEPHFGGHIERLLGTTLRQIHKLPGTTFGSIQQRTGYDSEGQACLTLDDLDHLLGRWFVEIYHHTMHTGINTTPIKKWEEGFFGANRRPLPMKIADEQKLRLAFMPFTERTIQPAGIEFEGLHYFADVLRSWVRSKLPGSTKNRRFVFTFDPRDISRLFFFDPESRAYFEIPFRDTSRGPVSIWEVRTARKRLAEENQNHVDEAMLFDKIHAIRKEMEQQAAKSKRLRREKQRVVNQAKSRNYITGPSVKARLAAEEGSRFDELMDDTPVEPFADLEKL
jgi:putative transposase